MDRPRPIKSVLPHVVVVNQALHGNTKVRGPGVLFLACTHSSPVLFLVCTYGKPNVTNIQPHGKRANPLVREICAEVTVYCT